MAKTPFISCDFVPLVYFHEKPLSFSSVIWNFEPPLPPAVQTPTSCSALSNWSASRGGLGGGVGGSWVGAGGNPRRGPTSLSIRGGLSDPPEVGLGGLGCPAGGE